MLSFLIYLVRKTKQKKDFFFSLGMGLFGPLPRVSWCVTLEKFASLTLAWSQLKYCSSVIVLAAMVQPRLQSAGYVSHAKARHCAIWQEKMTEKNILDEILSDSLA